MSANFQTNDFLSSAQVMQRYGGVSHMWIVRKMRDEGMPSPVRFGGRLRFWKVADLERWERSKITGGSPKTKTKRAA